MKFILESKLIFEKYLKNFFTIKPIFRTFILVICDFVTLYLASIICNKVFLIDKNNLFIFSRTFIQVIFGLTIYFYFGQYKALTRYISSKMIYNIFLRNFSLVLILYFIDFFIKTKSESFFYYLFFLVLSTFFEGSIRILLRDMIKLLKTKNSSKFFIEHVVIYGATDSGVLLSKFISNSREFVVDYFIDEDKNLWERELNGILVKSPNFLKISQGNISKIFITLPKDSNSKKREILEFLSKFNLPILEVPTVKELASGRIQINSLKPIHINDILARLPIDLERDRLNFYVNKKTICVTGAGGSIGSELSKQIIEFQPKKILLIDNTELNLYNLKNQLLKIISSEVELKSYLCDVNNIVLIKRIFFENRVDIVFHAAAYKHVPLVEENIIYGLLNNVLSTRRICEAAVYAGVRNIVLISSDKAVRPTNIMGASKRLSELIFQAYSEDSLFNKQKEFIFSIVRFGNVLDSSGSVVPLFRKQISEGGPITITHPEIIRYFMTIHEAVGLVLQTLELAKGGEIFLLDMGEPVKILTLAKQMIKLSGLKLKNKDNPNGDIEIVYKGLRPGEKLFEELLISKESEETSNPKIFKANENFIYSNNLFPYLDKLEKYLLEDNEKEVLEILHKLVPEWTRS